MATVSHHGSGAARGHYTAAVRLRERGEGAGDEEAETKTKGAKKKSTNGSGGSSEGKKGVSFRSPLVERGRQISSSSSSSSRWLFFDDDRVREVGEEEVTDGGAYLLFYELV